MARTVSASQYAGTMRSRRRRVKAPTRGLGAGPDLRGEERAVEQKAREDEEDGNPDRELLDQHPPPVRMLRAGEKIGVSREDAQRRYRPQRVSRWEAGVAGRRRHRRRRLPAAPGLRRAQTGPRMTIHGAIISRRPPEHRSARDRQAGREQDRESSKGDEVRASDDERHRITDQLRIHCVAGRITVEELERRLELAMSAQDRSRTRKPSSMTSLEPTGPCSPRHGQRYEWGGRVSGPSPTGWSYRHRWSALAWRHWT